MWKCQDSWSYGRILCDIYWCGSWAGLFHSDPTLIARPWGKITKCSPRCNQDEAVVIQLSSDKTCSLMNKEISPAYWNVLITPKTPRSTIKSCVDLLRSSDASADESPVLHFWLGKERWWVAVNEPGGLSGDQENVSCSQQRHSQAAEPELRSWRRCSFCRLCWYHFSQWADFNYLNLCFTSQPPADLWV